MEIQNPNQSEQDKSEKPKIVFGNTVVSIEDVLDETPEAMAKIEAWIAKKEKALDRAEKRSMNKKRK